MTIGRFTAGIAALIYSPAKRMYLLLRRSREKDYAPGTWECVTGRVDQGEAYEQALSREVMEELGVTVSVEYILGTTHFYRGELHPTNELLGVVYLCSLAEAASIRLSAEHDEYRWVSVDQVHEMLTSSDPSTQWISKLIFRAEEIRGMLPEDLRVFQERCGFELG